MTLLLALLGAALAAPPSTLAWTGALLDGAGIPVADGSYAVSFRLYDTPTAGELLWSELLAVDTAFGSFSTTLGADGSLEGVFGQTDAVWLELVVEGEALSPRLAVASVPWALRSAVAEDVECIDCVGGEQVDASKVQARVTGTCGAGDVVVGVNEDGSVACETPSVDLSGLVTGVTAGAGLTASGSALVPELALDVARLASCPTGFVTGVDEVSGAFTCGEALDATSFGECPEGDFVVGIHPTSGVVLCETTAAGLEVTAGSGLVAIGSSESVELSLDWGVFGECPPGHVVVGIDAVGSGVLCAVDDVGGDVTAVLAGAGLTGGSEAGEATLALDFQVFGACSSGMYVTGIDPSSGEVQCALDEVGTGDVTAVLAGTGLTGGAASGDVVLGVDYAAFGACAPGSVVTGIDATTGEVGCAADAEGTGDITAVVAGEGLTGGAESGSAELALDLSAVQARVTDSCVPGAAIRSIGADGSVECDTTPSPHVPRDNTISIIDSAGEVRHTSMRIPADGLPVISYNRGADLVVAKCNDVRCEGGDETITVIASPGAAADGNSMALGLDGLPVIAFRDDVAGGLKIAKCNDPACSGGDETITLVDAVSDPGHRPKIAVGVDGVPVVSHYSASDAHVRFTRCLETSCAAFPHTTATLEPAGIEYTDVLIGVFGLPVVVYVESVDLKGKLIYCDDVACGTYTVVTAGGSAPTHEVAATIGETGGPVVAFTRDASISPNTVLTVVCVMPGCDGGTRTEVTAVNPSPQNLSVTIDDQGAPIIAFHDGATDELKVARCTDIDCGRGRYVDGVTSGTNGGQGNSIAIASDGFPLIAYGTSSNELAVLACANAFCLPNWSRR